jgi:benzoylformate decarboxylase
MPVENQAGRTAANILLDVLESEDCEYIFGNPGTTELPLIDALVDRPRLHYVLGLQNWNGGVKSSLFTTRKDQ